MLKILTISILAISILFQNPSIAAENEFVVLKSTVSQYKPGDRVKGETVIKVPKDKILVLINAYGQTLKIEGSFNKPLQEKALAEKKGQQARSVQALASLVRTADEDTGSVGAIRAASLKTVSQAMAINLSETGDYCYVNESNISLDRYKNEKGKTATLTNLQTGESQTISGPGRERYQNSDNLT